MATARPVAGPRRIAPSMPAGRGAGRERASRDAGAVTGATPRRPLGAFIPAVGRRWPRRSHQARKAAKKTRYSTEPARASLGKPAKRLGKRVKAVQKALGDHQDTVVARDALRHLALAAHAAGEPGFTWGLLYGQGQAVAKVRERELPAAWADASKPGLRKALVH